MSKHILVIDDEPNLRHMLTVVLEKAGYTVSSAADGAEALSLTETNSFDLILCDCACPGWTVSPSSVRHQRKDLTQLSS
jgi:two-component system response regulator AtoC